MMARLPRYEWEGTVRRLALPRGVKLVAATMAQYANPDGTQVRPGRERVAEETGYSLKQVDRHLKTLRDLGLLVRVRMGSANGRRALADEYRLAIPEDILDRVDLVKPINVGPVDNPPNSGRQMSGDQSDESDSSEPEQWTSDDDSSAGSLDTGVPITGHLDVHPPTKTTPVTTPTPDNRVLQDRHLRREAPPVDNVLPFRRRGAA
jgi:DNA-binding transcriptional ArsR family regulator